MINTQNSLLLHLAVHFVGNKSNEEELILSKKPMQLQDDEVEALLMKYFLSPFKNNEYFHLFDESDLVNNEMYSVASKIFSDPDSFFLQSLTIAQHLFERSAHPVIKGGELYLIYLQDCMVEGEPTDAIGIFKSETKETYLKVAPSGNNYSINSDNGININKLDKGCLIFNIDKDKGYRVCMVDTTARSNDTQHWKNDFLNLKSREDSFYHTQNYLQLCKGFVEEKFKEEFEISKTDEIDFMNKSVKFFKERETFDLNDFNNEIIQQPEVIDAFKSYKETYQRDRDVNIAEEFNISQNAVKSTSRIFKSILKLDKNFSVYIHGNKNNIVKGYDEAKGLHFYQLYYKEEK
jgi:hypothetical protein